MKKRLISILLLVTMLFTMLPAEALAAVTNKVTAAADSVKEKKPENPFADVREGSWYYDAVQYARSNGFFNGTSANTFDPDGTMTRGMFVTVLGRMAGVDQSVYKGQSAFSDVAADAYYAPYVAWASKHGITSGVGEGKFDPDGLITREQMAVFFVRYFEAFDVDYDTGSNITTVPADLDTVSPWAREMVLKLWKTGLLAGDGTNFNPTGNANRAQAATLCMRADKAVETWYREPGIPSDRISVDPDAEQKPETPKTPGSSGGGSTTTYYKVTFVIDSISEEKVYPKDTLLSTLPIPTLTGKIFLGWYHDAGKTNPVAVDDKLTANITLYAKLTDAVALDEEGAPNFVSALDQMSNLTLSVKKIDGAPILGTDFKFRNITAPDKTPETKSGDEDEVNTETVKVEGGSGGVWTISSASGGFTPGHTYQIELISDAVAYDDSVAAIKDFKAAHGQENIAQVRFFNFSIEKDGTLNLKLNDDIKYIGVDKLNPADGASLMEYAGLYLASTDGEGNTTYTANDGTGSFTYTGSDIKVGDIVSVYTGTKPTERKPEKGTANKTNNEDVSYVKITVIDGSTYYYVAAEAEEVLFTPDVLPVDVDASEKTGWTKSGTSVVIDNDKLDFAIGYEKMGLSAETTVDKGDFLAFYTGSFGQDDAKDEAYGEIIDITVNGNTTTITYKEVSEDQVMSAMDMYDETQLNDAELEKAINENKDEIQQIIEAQLMESDFFDDAGEYLAGLAIQTDEIKEIFGSGDNLTLSDYTITYSDGTPLGAHDLTLMGNIVDAGKGGIKASVTVTPRLAHFKYKKGIRAEVAVTYKFDIQKSGSNNKVEVELTAFFEQEVVFDFGVSGGAVWKWKWIFPYIADFRMTGKFDIGTYTGVGITATAKLAQDGEPWGMSWPSDLGSAANDIINLSESIKELMADVNSVLPKAEGTSTGGLAEKYAVFMKDANKEWVDLIKVNLVDLHGAVDPLHILAYGLQVDFVVSANLNVAIGMTFQYENYKRHTFTLSLKSKKADSDTVDLSTNGYRFDFYVLGTLGIRAGIRAKATMGLFSTKLAGIGLQIEAGAYARLWGYFYYSLTNYKIEGVWVKNSSSSGAMMVEIGAYLDLKFIAEVLNGKYSYAPTIYAKEWPLWSAGQRENVYDFAYEDDPTYTLLNVSTYTIPSVVYDMLWMDLKTGEMKTEGKANTKNYDSDTATGSDDELRFAVELSNSNFTYDPATNQITINTGTGDVRQSCDMTITWKNAPMAGSSEAIRRTITLNWSTDINKSIITFESNGGSAVDMLIMITDADISQKMPQAPKRTGYIFSGWYTDRKCLNEFKATIMPEGHTTLYAKWVPDLVTYTVEHYKKELDGRYVLVKTNRLRGYTGDLTSAAPENYAGFTAQQPKQQIIAPEGSTRILVYYNRNSYELKFVLDENNDITMNMPYGSTIVPPSNPYKQGYTFAGWDKIVRSTMPDDALTYTARWTPKTDTYYRVNHYTENLHGTFALVETEGKFGTTGKSTNATDKTFTGFTVKKPITQKTILPDGSTVVEIYYDRKSHLLSWNFNGGEVPAGTSYTDGTVKYGTTLVMPTLKRTGYAFEGWYKDALLTKKLGYSETTMPDTPLTLYAKWVEGQTTYTVKHIRQSYDGSFPESGELVETFTPYGKTGELTAVTAKNYTGYRKPTVNNMIIEADGSTVLELKYYAYSYTIYFDGNEPDGGNMGSQTFLHGDPKGLLANGYTKANHAFTGWNTSAYGIGLSYAVGTPVMDLVSRMDFYLTLTLYAQWKFDHIIVSFDSNQGSGSSVPTTAANIQAPYLGNYGALPTVSRNGYTFAGWYTAKSGGTEVTSSTKVTSTSNQTLYARWMPIFYDVEFNANGGSNTMEAQTFCYDAAAGELTANAFTRLGYTFNGWNTKADGSGRSYANRASVRNLTYTANDVITLYAQWIANTYVVKFNANGGSGSMEDQTFVYGQTQPLTANAFTRDFYTFNGWNTTSNGSGISYADGEPVTDLNNVTLYAQWTLSAHTVSFNSNKGSGSSYPTTAESILVNYGEAYGQLPTVSRSGYTFDGWYTSSGTAVSSTVKVTEDHTLYAHWTANTYTVKFDKNGGSGSMPDQIFTYDVLQKLTKNVFTKNSEPFIGWNTKADGSGTSFGDEASVGTLTGEKNGSVTLYALWKDNSAAQIGSNRYATLQAAVDAVTNGQTIQMLRDSVGALKTESYDAMSFTLDLNGKTLSNTFYAIWHDGSGKLTIIDTAGGGKITSTDAYGSDRGTITLTSTSYASGLDIQGGTIENINEEGYGTAILNKGGGSINIYSGTVSSTGTAIKNLGSGNVNLIDGSVTGEFIVIENSSSGNINVSGGTVYGSSQYGISNTSTGAITISGTATILNDSQAKLATTYCAAIRMYGDGPLVIRGGTVKSTITTAIYSEGACRIHIEGDTLVTSANPPEGRGTIYLANGSSMFSIIDATVENTHENGIAIQEDKSGVSAVNLSGSVVIKGGGMAMNKAPHVTWDPLDQITASTDVSGLPTVPYVAADITTYKYLKLDGHLNGTHIAKIEATGTEYTTLQAAFDEVAEGEVIQLLDDITLTIPITIARDVSKSFILDLNDHILVANSLTVNYCSIRHEGSGELTITDNSANRRGKIINKKGNAIYLNGGSLVVAGGTVQNYLSSESVVQNNGSGSITITGGEVLGEGAVIYNQIGNVDISGGMVRNIGTGRVIYSGGKVTISGTAILTSTFNGGSSAGAIEFYKASDTPVTILEIKGGTIDNNGSGNAIYIRAPDFLAVSISGGPSIIKSSSRAINVAPHVEEGFEVTASTDYDGTATVDYVETDIKNYKYLRFE